MTAAPRLEMWLQNPKLMCPAQELLMSACLNCSTHSQRDVEVISHLVKIRLKTKALINLYLSCIRYSKLTLNEHPVGYIQKSQGREESHCTYEGHFKVRYFLL
jgi:integrator complex subunit 1